MGLFGLFRAFFARDAARPAAAPVPVPLTNPPPPAPPPSGASGAKSEKALTSRGYRNKNPGNIDWLPAHRAWNGQIAKESGPTGRFGIYDTHENGIRALAKQLRKYQDAYEINTIRGIINRWAPPIENATNSYISRVDAAMPHHSLDDGLNLSEFKQLRALAEAIIIVECGGNPYDPDEIDRGVRKALA